MKCGARKMQVYSLVQVGLRLHKIYNFVFCNDNKSIDSNYNKIRCYTFVQRPVLICSQKLFSIPILIQFIVSNKFCF